MALLLPSSGVAPLSGLRGIAVPAEAIGNDEAARLPGAEPTGTPRLMEQGPYAYQCIGKVNQQGNTACMFEAQIKQ